MKKLVVAGAVFCVSATALAATNDAPRWNFVEVTYEAVDTEVPSLSPVGLAVKGAWLLSDDIFVMGRYSYAEDDIFGIDVDIEQQTLGLGYRFAFADNADIYAAAALERVSIGASLMNLQEDVTETGVSVMAGMRTMMSKNFELGAYVGLNNLDGLDVGWGANATFYLLDNVAAHVEYRDFVDIQTLSVGVRVAF